MLNEGPQDIKTHTDIKAPWLQRPQVPTVQNWLLAMHVLGKELGLLVKSGPLRLRGELGRGGGGEAVMKK